jgi:hypothetical protein
MLLVSGNSGQFFQTVFISSIVAGMRTFELGPQSLRLSIRQDDHPVCALHPCVIDDHEGHQGTANSADPSGVSHGRIFTRSTRRSTCPKAPAPWRPSLRPAVPERSPRKGPRIDRRWTRRGRGRLPGAPPAPSRSRRTSTVGAAPPLLLGAALALDAERRGSGWSTCERPTFLA